MELLDDPLPPGVERLLGKLAGGHVGPAEAAPRMPPQYPATARRLEWFRRAAHLCPECELTVDAKSVRARITRPQLCFIYLPLCEWMLDEPVPEDARRLILGVTGGPGSGKSIFCALLERVVAAVGPEPPPVVRISLDGWHRPNRWLAECGLEDDKGLLETFDTRSFLAALRRLRTEDSLRLPRYDRNLHDPVEGAIGVDPHHRAALVEGNFLLRSRGPWRHIAPLLDLSVFLSRPLEEVRPRIVGRHVRGGRSPENARHHFEKVDLPNYHRCLQTAPRADHILHLRHDDGR